MAGRLISFLHSFTEFRGRNTYLEPHASKRDARRGGVTSPGCRRRLGLRLFWLLPPALSMPFRAATGASEGADRQDPGASPVFGANAPRRTLLKSGVTPPLEGLEARCLARTCGSEPDRSPTTRTRRARRNTKELATDRHRYTLIEALNATTAARSSVCIRVYPWPLLLLRVTW